MSGTVHRFFGEAVKYQKYGNTASNRSVAFPSKAFARAAASVIPFLNRSCRFRRAADSAVARQGEVDKGTGDSEAVSEIGQ
jgi:hypothetical protein